MFKENELSLVYFNSDPKKGRVVLDAGADALILDCENVGKSKRQEGFDTQINYNKPSQIKDMREANPNAHIMCRVNNANDITTETQIKIAISFGADTIVLPLTESAEQVRKINKVIEDNAKLIVMIETQKGVDNFSSISGEKFDAVYVGLNDLSISRGGTPLFEPLTDGTIEQLISKTDLPVGVGGVTDPSEGDPIKSATIISHYAKLGVRFTFLRRSFEQTILSKPAKQVISSIKESYEESLKKKAKTLV